MAGDGGLSAVPGLPEAVTARLRQARAGSRIIRQPEEAIVHGRPGAGRPCARGALARAETLAAAGPEAGEAFMEADKEVHPALARPGGGPLHVFFLASVHDNLHHYHISAYLPRGGEMIRTTLEELQGLVSALGPGDGERAGTPARNHVQRAAAILRRRPHPEES